MEILEGQLDIFDLGIDKEGVKMNGEVLKKQLMDEHKEMKKWDELREEEKERNLKKREELLLKVDGAKYGY